MKNKTYYASFSTSNGSYCENDYVFTNKKTAIKTIREIGIANTFIGDSVNLSVTDNNGSIIYEKTIFVK